MTRKDSHALWGQSAGLRFPIGLLLSLLLLTVTLGSADRASAGGPRTQVEPTAPTACPPPSTLTFGATIQCSIDTAGEVDAFTVSLSAGDRIRVRVVETSGTLVVRHEIVRPDGSTLCNTVADELSCTATTSGVHIVLVRDAIGTRTGNYSLYGQRLNNPVGCTAIAYGTTTPGNIEVPAAHDCYTFSLSVGDRIRVRVVETSGTLVAHHEIVRPDGSTLCNTVADELSCTATTSGVHTVLVGDAIGTRTGNYSLYSQRLNNPVGCTAIAYGTTTPGNIEVPAAHDCYTFDLSAGKQIRVLVVETAGTLVTHHEIVRPDGSALCSTVADELSCTATTSGVHTVLVRDAIGTRTGQYRLTLTCLTPPCGGTPPAPSFFASAAGSGTAGGVAFAPADILAYNGAANTWQMHYDGSDVAATRNVGAFAFEGGNLLLAFSASQPIAGQGTFTPWDVARFTPTSVGPNTDGSFGWYFDGSDVGLTLAGEKIDALGRASNGRLLISTVGVAKVPGPGGAVITAQDEDVLAFTPTSTGQNTAGTWALYFDGTPIPGLGVEDINGFWENPVTGDRYITILGAFNLAGVAGDGKDIVKLTPNAGAPGGYAPSLAWDGSAFGLPGTLDALEMQQP